MNDLIISGGATLEISNGAWTQVNGGSYIQLGANGPNGGGGGNILVNGGTFNQGTSTSNPFQSTGTGNTFTITAGVANFTETSSNQPGVAWLIQGGTVNMPNQWTIGSATGPLVITGGVVNGPSGGGTEFDVNSGGQVTMNGGQFSISRLMNLGNSVDGVNFGGGIFIDSATSDQGWYGPNPLNFNFTVGSTGTMEFAYGGASSFANYAAAQSQINTWISNGDISYNSGTNVAAFTVSDNGVGDALVTDNFAIPEPTTYALLGFGGLGMWGFVRRKKARIIY